MAGLKPAILEKSGLFEEVQSISIATYWMKIFDWRGFFLPNVKDETRR
jgi:hypothetical protein